MQASLFVIRHGRFMILFGPNHDGPGAAAQMEQLSAAVNGPAQAVLISVGTGDGKLAGYAATAGLGVDGARGF
jgi:hypothetical protein